MGSSPKSQDDGAYLGVGVKGQRLVDAPELSVHAPQHVVRLAVGVIGNQVEAADGTELVGGLFIKAVPGYGVVVLPGIVFHEELGRADAVGAVADDGEGDEIPAQHLAQQVGGVLPFVKRARGKIPQGNLAANGFINGFALPSVERQLGEKGVVGSGGSQVASDEFARS